MTSPIRMPRHIEGSAFVVLALILQEVGASIAVTLFPITGAVGMVALRLVLSAVILWVLVRPKVRGLNSRSWGLAAAYGLVLAAMNFFFYLALDRLPLGAAVTFEVLGPLALSVIAGRRWLSVLWAVVALAGVCLLAGDPTSNLDTVGIMFALIAAVLWAGYILLTKKAGRSFAGLTGLTLGMSIGGLVVAPAALVVAGPVLLAPGVLAVGAGVALLSSAAPYALEMMALRRLPAATFSVLLALAPAVAALAGLVILDQSLSIQSWGGMVLVIIASMGAIRTISGRPSPRGDA